MLTKILCSVFFLGMLYVDDLIASDASRGDENLMERKSSLSIELEDASISSLDVRCSLKGKWSILLPPDFEVSNEEGGPNITYTSEDKSVFAFSVSDPSGKIPAFILDEEVENTKIESYRFDMNGRLGRAVLARAPDIEGGYLFLVCQVAVPGSLCHVILSMDEDKNLDWAIKTFKSIEQIN
jgi:hypothetical protein